MSRESEEPGDAEALPEYAERVLEVAELIPPGRVMSYGDVAEWLASEDEDEGKDEGRAGDRPGGGRGGGPRQVGRAMALYGGAVPWWRVVRADGVLLPGHEQRALAHYREEGTPLREAARSTEGHLPRIRMSAARWDGRTGTDSAAAGPGARAGAAAGPAPAGGAGRVAGRGRPADGGASGDGEISAPGTAPARHGDISHT